METFATVISVALFALIVWQVLGSIINIIGIVVGLFKKEGA